MAEYSSTSKKENSLSAKGYTIKVLNSLLPEESLEKDSLILKKVNGNNAPRNNIRKPIK